MNYEQTTATTTTDPVLIDSDRESTKSDSECDPVPAKKQDMFIWNQQYEVLYLAS